MSKEIKYKIVPMLRFPEFVYSGEWILCYVKDVFTIFQGFAFSSSNNVSEGVRWLKIADVSIQYMNHNAPTFLPTEFKEKYKNFLVKKDDYVIALTRPILSKQLKIAQVDDVFHESLLNQRVGKLVTNKNIHFVYFLIQTSNLISSIEKSIAGSEPPNLSVQQIENIKIYIPSSLDEQQKIANCLSSLDELITSQNQKILILKDHKKGLMQQLFPAEGETVPELRFEEFMNSEEWEEKTLGEIGDFCGGGTPSKANESFWEGDIPWISSSNISEESIHEIKINRFITYDALEKSATKMVPANSILLVARVGVGKLAVTMESICTSQDFTNFTPENDNLIFLAYFLKTQKETLLKFSQGMAIKGFTKEDIVTLKILMPLTQEQEKIADCLSSLDELIKAQTKKIEQLKVHKKGLMQQLFPVVIST